MAMLIQGLALCSGGVYGLRGLFVAINSPFFCIKRSVSKKLYFCNKKGPGVTRARKEYEATAKKTSPPSYSLAPTWANLCVYFGGDFQFDGVNHDVGRFACFFHCFNAQGDLIVDLEH